MTTPDPFPSPAAKDGLFSPSTPATLPRQRSLLPITVLVLVVVAMLVAWMSRERWWPVPSVAVVRALPAAQASAAGDTPASSAQRQQWVPASGWMVAWPHMYSAGSQVSGSVAELLVHPGQQVEAGEVIARLHAGSAERALAMALAEEAAAVAAVEASSQEIAIQQAHLRQLQAELQQAQHQHQAVVVRWERVEAGGESISSARRQDLSLERAAAQAAVQAASAALAQAEAREHLARAQHNRAQADHEAAHSRMRQRAWEVEEHSIRSPIDGVVAAVLCQPGQWLHTSEEHDGASVAHIYKPQQLAAAVDVPLASLPGIRDGAPARIRCDALPDVELAARVQTRQGQADRSRGTLRLYLTLEDAAPASLRPEMLIRARIASSASSGASPAEDGSAPDDLTIIPPLGDAGAEQLTWWMVDPQQRLRQVELTIIERHDSHLLVRGLSAGDLLLAEPWPAAQSGMRVRPLVTELP